MPRVRFNYEPEGLLGRSKLKVGTGANKHESWADALLPADADAVPREEPASRRSLLVLAVLTGIVFIVLIGRLAMLQIAQGKSYALLADGNRIRTKVTRAPRGVLYDRSGTLLARNQPIFDLTVIPAQLPRDKVKRQAVYAKAAELSGVSAETLATTAEAKGLSYNQSLLLVSDVPRDKALQLDSVASTLPGVNLDVNTVRQYLDGGSLGSLLGYTGRISAEEYKADTTGSYQATDYIGKNGIEKQYESVLRGSNGTEQTEVDVSEKPVKVLATKPSVAGQNVTLTIDKPLQDKLVSSIQEQLNASGSGRGAGVVLNPQTGEILAMASLPGYDNNLFSKGISSKDYAGLVNNPNQPLFNKAFQGAYAAGSIIKPLVATAALTEKIITPETAIEDKGSLEVKNQYDPSIVYTYRTWEPGGLGVVNLSKAIALSSDVFFYTVGGGFGPIRGLGAKKLDAWYQKFGLGSKTGIDLPSEASGLVPSPESKQKATGEPWTIGDSYNISVGQGDLLTSPLQMAVATAAVANGGTLYKPHLVSKISDDSGRVIKTIKPEVVRSNIASPEVLSIVRDAMRQVVTSGTACCKIEKEVPVAVAGKTGTAETDPTRNKKPNAWFTSFAPFDNPKLVTVILIESSGEGAEYAAPATREVLKYYFSR